MGVDSTMTIRPACQEDYAEFVRLERQIAQLHCDAYPDIFKPTTDRGEKEFRELLKDADWDLLVAAQGDVLLGFASCHVREQSESDSTYARREFKLASLCVEEAHRGEGIGSALLTRSMAIAKERGFPRLALNVWGFNEAARRFYEKHGFHAVRTWMDADV
jgi:ribosomal protein S18 acetylase RimI-like enzyme